MRTKIKVQNFAKIEYAEIYVDDFVLFVGDNNIFNGADLWNHSFHSGVESRL